MGLFDVPGWSVPKAGPEPEPTSRSASKKRKRASLDSSDSRIKSAEANVDKLVQKLRGPLPPTIPEESSHSPTKSGNVFKTALTKHSERKNDKRAKALEEKKKLISHPRPLQSSAPSARPPRAKHQRQLSDSSVKSSPPKKKLKTDHSPSQKTVKFAPEPVKARESDADTGLTELQKGMKQSLSGARFRLVLQTVRYCNY